MSNEHVAEAQRLIEAVKAAQNERYGFEQARNTLADYVINHAA